MPKTKSAACDQCGAPIWPDNRRPRPWLCWTCRFPNATPHARSAPPVWRLADAAGRTTGLVLESCPGCGASPFVASTAPRSEAPRAIGWSHADDCSLHDTDEQIR